MIAELPEITGARDGTCSIRNRAVVGWIGLVLARPVENQIDLSGLETCKLQLEIEHEACELGQLEGERLAVPAGVLGQTIAGQPERAAVRAALLLTSGHGRRRWCCR